MTEKAQADSGRLRSSLGYEPFVRRSLAFASLLLRNAADPRVFAAKVARACSGPKRPPRCVAAGTGIALAFLLDAFVPDWVEEIVYGIISGTWPRGAAVKAAAAARSSRGKKAG
jgi:hypothetical protein